MTPDNLLKQYAETGNLIWTDDPTSPVKWVANDENGKIRMVQTTPFKQAVFVLGARVRSLNLGAFLSDKWAKEVINTVGLDGFVETPKNEFENCRRNLWFSECIEQVIIKSCYHRKEAHKIPKIKAEYERKRNKLKVKMVSAKLKGDKPDNTLGLLHITPRRVGKSAGMYSSVYQNAIKGQPTTVVDKNGFRNLNFDGLKKFIK